MGTPAYLSPEQAQGKTVDFQTDIFALGLVIYELASGVNPFISSSVEVTIERIVKSEPVPLSSRLRERVPELDRIVATCLQKDPAARYKSTQEMVADFERLEANISNSGRHADDVRSSRTRIPHPTALNDTALWWWEFHQIAMSSIYTVMMLPVWYVQRWVGEPPFGTIFLFAVLGAAASGASLRLHLIFSRVRCRRKSQRNGCGHCRGFALQTWRSRSRSLSGPSRSASLTGSLPCCWRRCRS
jgi:serine/threonine protein kinase